MIVVVVIVVVSCCVVDIVDVVIAVVVDDLVDDLGCTAHRTRPRARNAQGPGLVTHKARATWPPHLPQPQPHLCCSPAASWSRSTPRSEP